MFFFILYHRGPYKPPFRSFSRGVYTSISKETYIFHGSSDPVPPSRSAHDIVQHMRLLYLPHFTCLTTFLLNSAVQFVTSLEKQWSNCFLREVSTGISKKTYSHLWFSSGVWTPCHLPPPFLWISPIDIVHHMRLLYLPHMCKSLLDNKCQCMDAGI